MEFKPNRVEQQCRCQLESKTILNYCGKKLIGRVIHSIMFLLLGVVDFLYDLIQILQEIIIFSFDYYLNIAC